MSLFHTSDVYKTQKQSADRDQNGYGFVLALICAALVLAVAGAIFTPANIGQAIGSEISLVGP